MTVIRKRTGDNGGCCNPYSELQLEIERVDQTAIDAKTTANSTEAHLTSIEGKVNEAIAVVPQVQTNTEAIDSHAAELMDHDAKINANTIVNDQQNTDIAALKTKTIDNAAAIETIENEVGPETVAGTIQYRLKDIDTKLPTAIKEVEMIANASTVTHKATHISGTAESDALPVVSREQAGIMSASVYAAMEDVIANNTSRISVLEQSAPTYDISGLVGPNPTNAEISAAFQQKYPTVPIQAGLRAADYDNAHFWQYGKNTWILLTQIDVQIATNQSLGIVKGSTVNGKIFVETDGSMSLKGYDALVSKDATHDSKIGTLETGLGNANARIDTTNDNVAKNAADIVTANGNISTNANDITSLKGRMATAEGQIATHETKINQHTQSINGLSTNVNGLTTDVNGLKTDVNGLKGRMTTAEGQIATHETKIDQHTQSINELSTDINGLNTSKQDKLIAGSGISIAGDGKTISASGLWIIHDHENIDDIITVSLTNSESPVYINVLKDLKFCVYNIFGPKSVSPNRPPSLEYLEFSLPKGNYATQCYNAIGITFLYRGNNTPQQTSSTYQAYLSVNSNSKLSLFLKCKYKRDSDKQLVDSDQQLYISPNSNAQHRVYALPSIIDNYNMAKAVGISDSDYANKEIISALLIKYQN